jgi:hypothetical protein
MANGAEIDATQLGILTRISDALGSYMPGLESDPREEVIITYTRGSGRFSPDKRFIALTMYQYKFNGEQDGYHEGVWERAFEKPEELIGRPDNPPDPLNKPVPTVPHGIPLAYTKGIWVFGDDSSITAVGPALSHLMPLKDGSFLFAVTCAQIITNGTGRYEGARGLKSSLGSTHIEAGVELFGPGEVKFTATTVDTFKVVRAKDIKR